MQVEGQTKATLVFAEEGGGKRCPGMLGRWAHRVRGVGGFWGDPGGRLRWSGGEGFLVVRGKVSRVGEGVDAGRCRFRRFRASTKCSPLSSISFGLCPRGLFLMFSWLVEGFTLWLKILGAKE